MILGSAAIKAAIAAGDIVIDPYVEKHVGPNSVDLRLGDRMLEVRQSSTIDVRVPNRSAYMDVPTKNGAFVLRPGKLYLAHTVEVAGSTRYVPCIEGRSSLARLGLHVHVSAGFGDVGFVNRWTLELVATVPIIIYAGMRIAQIFFQEVSGIDAQYRGKYGRGSGSGSGPRPSEIWRDFVPEPDAYNAYNALIAARRASRTGHDDAPAQYLRVFLETFALVGPHLDAITADLEDPSGTVDLTTAARIALDLLPRPERHLRAKEVLNVIGEVLRQLPATGAARLCVESLDNYVRRILTEQL